MFAKDKNDLVYNSFGLNQFKVASLTQLKALRRTSTYVYDLDVLPDLPDTGA